ncbi:GntR family transcriptional regulator [Vagococcus sp. BWB3-3]|uniref:GntR family transcriptional regulator n=1 Tax=Vagococcus allomyrinae TaxID=2794353 RepID=A0A940P8M3_9ENTE|nr:GntR family transcriptional regulator [Vagococcus allomyrinae]
MLNQPKARRSRYQKVAVDVAKRISQNEFQVGDKLHARSKLANYYNVSPETARKAVTVLVDLDIVKVKHGSGFTVASTTLAREFVEQYHDVQTIGDLKVMLEDSMMRQQEELSFFAGALNQLLVQTDNFYTTNPLNPFHVKVTEDCRYLNETVADINLWQQTTATLIAINRENELFVSPGPYAQLLVGDLLYFVGNDLSNQQVEKLFYPEE